MKRFVSTLASITLLGFAVSANAQTAQEAADLTVSKRSVNYSCDLKRKVKVTYGFNKQGLPTFAESKLNGKKRFMPINLSRSDNVDTIFGDDNNFSLTTDAMTNKNYRSKAILIMDPASEILFKNCKPR